MRWIALRQGANNAITYNTSKTKAMLFSKACWQKLTKWLETRLKIGGKTICSKKETT